MVNGEALINQAPKSSIQNFAHLIGLTASKPSADKFLKREILEELKFNYSSIKRIEQKKDFIIGDTQSADIDQYVQERLKSGNSVTMRFINDGGVKSGGYPVLFAGEAADYTNRIVLDENRKPVGWRAIDNSIVLASPELLVQTFSVIKSQALNVHGLDNYEGHKKIRLGGGFRLQLDKVNTDLPGFDFSSIFVFDDVPPRSTDLSSDFDITVPRTTTKFSAEQQNDGLVVDNNLLTGDYVAQVLKTGNIKEITQLLIKKLFADNKKPFSRLFNSLMDLNPVGKKHSIEGVFSFQKDDRGQYFLIQIVTDFDGIDSTDKWKQKDETLETDAVKRITKAHLQLMRKKTKDNIMMENANYFIDDERDKPKKKFDELDENGQNNFRIIESVFDKIKGMTYRQFAEEHDMRREQVKLGKLLKLANGIEFTIDDSPIVSKELKGRNGAIIKGAYFSVAGEPFGSVNINGKIIHESKELFNALDLPKAIYDSLREGD